MKKTRKREKTKSSKKSQMSAQRRMSDISWSGQARLPSPRRSAAFTLWNSGSFGLRFGVETRPFQIRLICSFCSSNRGFACGLVCLPTSDFLQIPPCNGRPCLWLTVPTAKSVADFHRQVIAHAERTRKKELIDFQKIG